jgi:hypothetical protein
MARACRAGALTVCLILMGAPGCQRGSKEQAAEKKDTGITRTAIRGPVTLSVQSDRSKATIAERFTLTITAVADDGVDVTMPQFGDSLGSFSIRDFHETTGRPIEGGKRQWQQVYQIDCELSGKYKVQPITVRFVDRRKRAAAQAGAPTTTAASQPEVASEVSTEEFELEVTSLLEGQFDPRKFRDVKGPADLPEPASRRYVWAIGGAAAVAAAVVIIGLLVRRRRRKGILTVQIPPHQWAMQELQRLIDEDLIGQGHVKLFYYRLNAIVRQYIELRFDLMAPEMTTEEFLETLRYSDRLAPAHKALLENFVTACDMVKYACYRPGKEEIEQVFVASRDLIDQTAQRGKEVRPPEEDQAVQEAAA